MGEVIGAGLDLDQQFGEPETDGIDQVFESQGWRGVGWSGSIVAPGPDTGIAASCVRLA